MEARKPRQFLYVPEMPSQMYEEACGVLHISPAASAMASRRCLQALFNELGFDQRNLVDQIAAANSDGRPSKLIDSFEVYANLIRYIGNLAAHPSGDPFLLEYEDADWCLDIIEELFDLFYEKPAQLQQRMMELEGRLVEKGKTLFGR